jgi:hypothetical protein
LANPDSVGPASKNLEVFRGLSAFDLLKLLEQLQEQVPAPVPSSTSGAPEEARRGTSFQTSSVTDTGNSICLDIAPPPGFQPRLILHQESISVFSTGNNAISGLPPVGDTGYEGVAALPVPPSLFSKGKEMEVTPRFHFWFADPIPDMESLLLPL